MCEKCGFMGAYGREVNTEIIVPVFQVRMSKNCSLKCSLELEQYSESSQLSGERLVCFSVLWCCFHAEYTAQSRSTQQGWDGASE